MVRVEFTLQRRHLFIIAGLFAAAVVLIPTVSRASHTFDDVDDANVFHTDIDWLAANDVTRGCNPPTNTRYCPGSNVTREQMAAFMKRLATNQVVDAGSLGGVDAETLIDRIEALESGGDGAVLTARIAALEDLLTGVSRNGDILLFDGMNLQVVNGQGSTATQNGLGNLIIGYNEDSTRDTAVALRTGSHYLIVGSDNEWTRHGGIVAGLSNTSTGAYASVTGGWNGRATVAYASVTGGHSNTASSNYATVTGGRGNTASGGDSTVSGGTGNTASGSFSSVTGGIRNESRLTYVTVVGGDDLVCGFADTAVCGEGIWLALD